MQMNFQKAQAKMEKMQKELMAVKVSSEMRKKEIDRLSAALEEAKAEIAKPKKKYTFDPPAYHDIKPILNDEFTIMESICGMNKQYLHPLESEVPVTSITFQVLMTHDMVMSIGLSRIKPSGTIVKNLQKDYELEESWAMNLRQGYPPHNRHCQLGDKITLIHSAIEGTIRFTINEEDMGEFA